MMHNSVDILFNEAQNEQNEPVPFTPADLKQRYALLYQSLVQAMPGFRVREQQEQIIECCGEAIRTHGIAAIQADTGVGKTLGYLLAALPFVTEQNKRLVVSTKTVALQTQLIEKDIPTVQANLASDIKVEIAKGVNRYYCPKRAHDLLAKTEKVSGNKTQKNLLDELIEEDELQANAGDDQIILVQKVYDAFADKSFSGDLDTCELPGITGIQNMLNRQSDRCPKVKNCDFGESCPYFKQREAIEKADIVIANHSLTSIAASNPHTVLGSLADDIIVFDEAHHVHDVYRDSLQSSFLPSEMESVRNKADKLRKLLSNLEQVPALFSNSSSDNLTTALNKFRDSVESNSTDVVELDSYLLNNFNTLRGNVGEYDNTEHWLLSLNPTEKSLSQLIQATLQALVTMNRDLTLLIKNSENAKFFEHDNLDQRSKRLVTEWHRLLDKLNTYFGEGIVCLQRYVEFDECLTNTQRIDSGLVRWIVRDIKKHGTVFHIKSNSVSIREHFKERVIDVAGSLVFTSATLKVLGGLEYFVEPLGLNDSDKSLMTADIVSPFDYQAACFSAPLFHGNPKSANHAETVLSFLQQSVNRHKSILVLFMSYRQMNEVFTLCSHALKRNILRQDDFSKRELIERHKNRIDAGETSILFGVDGLSEGLDLQQHYLTCVLITKLPFPALNEPMFKHLSCMLEAKGQSSFVQQSLPICERKLIQSVGRLIRSEQDYGEVILLDPRVNTSRYGKSLLAAIPMIQRNSSAI
ncbi:helicase C-terminal domain-containing protein [Thalassotalea ponticola]|uniref:helicase C-terminal domain-containing protein n=1 Tax=Thalassotalea ponticola TaxID=1523392 RepID=UPI0025B373D5|nr:helicase C-terminal domain-containing protein [Thalassotalea ponticola]MDN3651354.1 helicase C-terminal domain-containing protein [Thalassotalea ponticola]